MKHRSTQHKVKANQDSSVITYPPGYKGQPLTEDSVFFSDRLMNCPEDYRGIFKILIQQFAVDLGCGDSERSRNYLKAVADGVEAIWYNDDLPAIVFLSIDEKCRNTSKRVLRIMPTLQLDELIVDDDVGSEVNRDDVTASDAETPDPTFAGTANF